MPGFLVGVGEAAIDKTENSLNSHRGFFFLIVKRRGWKKKKSMQHFRL